VKCSSALKSTFENFYQHLETGGEDVFLGTLPVKKAKSQNDLPGWPPKSRGGGERGDGGWGGVENNEDEDEDKHTDGSGSSSGGDDDGSEEDEKDEVGEEDYDYLTELQTALQKVGLFYSFSTALCLQKQGSLRLNSKRVDEGVSEKQRRERRCERGYGSVMRKVCARRYEMCVCASRCSLSRFRSLMCR
jgi:hypothetical protein